MRRCRTGRKVAHSGGHFHDALRYKVMPDSQNVDGPVGEQREPALPVGRRTGVLKMILATGAPTRWPGRLALPLGGRCRPCRCALGDEDDWGRGAQNSAGRADSEPTR